MKARTRKLRTSRRLHAADLRLRRNYGKGLDDYTLVFLHQDRRCAICRRSVRIGKSRLAVDHCHATGLLRGLLCWPCNRALAHFHDDLGKLNSAVEYLVHPPFTAVFGCDQFTAPGKVGTKRRAKLLRAMQNTGSSI